MKYIQTLFKLFFSILAVVGIIFIIYGNVKNVGNSVPPPKTGDTLCWAELGPGKAGALGWGNDEGAARHMALTSCNKTTSKVCIIQECHKL